MHNGDCNPEGWIGTKQVVMTVEVPAILTAQEVADYLRCHVNHARALIRSGEIKSVQWSGREHRVRAEDLKAYVNR